MVSHSKHKNFVKNVKNEKEEPRALKIIPQEPDSQAPSTSKKQKIDDDDFFTFFMNTATSKFEEEAKAKNKANFKTLKNVTKKEVKNFFNHLVLSVNQPSKFNCKNLNKKHFEDSQIFPKIKEIFFPTIQQDSCSSTEEEQSARELTNESFENFLKIRELIGNANKDLKKVEKIWFNNDFVNTFENNSKILILRTPKGLRALGLKVIIQLHNLQTNDFEKGKVIATKSSTLNDAFLCAIKWRKPDKVLIEVEDGNSFYLESLNNKLQNVSKKIFICDFSIENTQFQRTNLTKILSESGNLITNLDKASQDALYTSYNVSFQSQNLTFSQILMQSRTFIKLLDDQTLAEHLNGELKIGNEINRSNFNEDFYEDFYVERIYEEQKHEKEEVDVEVFKTSGFIKNLLNQESSKKPVLIHDVAGMGKSTEITKIAIEIKKMPDIWVLKLELGSNKFFNAFQRWKTDNLLDFFKKFQANTFDCKMFDELYEQGKVAILLDGFDEISSQIISEVLQKLFEKILNENSKNIFIITSRTNMVEDLVKEEVKNTKSKIREKSLVYHLKHFDNDQQIKFVKDWILKFFKDRSKFENFDEELPKFCEDLIDSLSSSINKGTNLLGIPLQIRMLAEIFANKIEIEGKFPEIPQKISLTELFRFFIDTKYMIHFRKPQTLAKYCVKLYKNEIQVEELLLKFAISLLKHGRNELDYSDEDRDLMIDVGLMSFDQNEPKFIHKAFPEFLVAEKFFEVFCEKDENKIKQMVESNQEILETVFKYGHFHEMMKKFLNEFLEARVEKFPETDVKVFDHLDKLKGDDTLWDDLHDSVFELQELCFLKIFLVRLLISKQDNGYRFEPLEMLQKFDHIDLKYLPHILELFYEHMIEAMEFPHGIFLDIFYKTLHKTIENCTMEGFEEVLTKAKDTINEQNGLPRTLFNLFIIRFFYEPDPVQCFTFEKYLSRPKDILKFLKYYKELDACLINFLQNMGRNIFMGEKEYIFVIIIDLVGNQEVKEFMIKWANEKGLDYVQKVKKIFDNFIEPVIKFLNKSQFFWLWDSLEQTTFLDPENILNFFMKNFNENRNDAHSPFFGLLLRSNISSEFQDCKQRLKTIKDFFTRTEDNRLKYEKVFENWKRNVLEFLEDKERRPFFFKTWTAKI